MTTAINYTTVTTAAGDVRLTASHLNQELGTLMGKVRAVAAHWDGEARTAYQESQHRLAGDMSGMTQELTRIAQLLDESVAGYRETDRANAARFRM